MITKFVGSPTDLNRVNRIALVYSSSVLLESQIPILYPDYFGTGLKRIVDLTVAEEDGKSINEFIVTGIESDPFEFNSIIFYDPGTNPIGFSMLDQSVNTNIYHIESIIIIPNFIIGLTSDRYIEIALGSTNYTEHIANTSSAHKKLFESEDYALTAEKVVDRESNPTKFTNQLKEAIQLDRVYRYSGNFSMLNNRLLQSNYNINYGVSGGTLPDDQLGSYVLPNEVEVTFKTKWNRIFKINNHYYFISYDNSNSKLVVKGLDNSVSITKTIPNIVQFGSNMFIIYSSLDHYTTYSTESLLKLSSNDDISKCFLNKISESLTNNIRFAREFDDDSIHPYELISTTGVNIITNRMKDLFDRLKADKYRKNISEIIGFSENLLVYKTDNIYNTYFLTDVPMSTDSGIRTNVPFIYGFEWSQIEVISNKAILIRRSGSNVWKLLRIVPLDLSKLAYRTIVYELGTNNNWRKLDFIAKTQINPSQLKILMTPIDGNLWKYIATSSNITFSTL